MVVVLAHVPRQTMKEPFGRMLVIDPGDWIQEGPQFSIFVVVQNRVDVKADRQSDAAVLGVERLKTAVAGCRPGFLRQRPGVDLAIMRHQSPVGSSKADGVEIL